MKKRSPVDAALHAYNQTARAQRATPPANKPALRAALAAYDTELVAVYQAQPEVDSVELLRQIARSPFAQNHIFHGYTLAAIAEGLAGALDVDTGNPAEDAFDPKATYSGQDVIERLRIYTTKQRALVDQIRTAVREERRKATPTKARR